MNIQEIYKLAIEIGIKNDFRPKERIEKIRGIGNGHIDTIRTAF